MPATFSAAGGGSDGAGGTTRDSTSIVVPAGAVVYALAVSADGTVVDCTGVAADPTGANEALTQLGTHLSLNANGRASLWRIVAPTAGTYIFRATWGSSQGERALGVWVGTGIDSTTPNETPVTATGTNTTPTATANTGIVSGDLVLSFGCYQWATNAPLAFDSPSGTERGEYTASNFCGLAFQEQTAAGASISPQWTLSGGAPNNWGIFVVALNDGVVGPPPQVARPDEDISDGAWTPSTGTDNYAVIDETSASDADYTSVNSNSTLEIGLGALSTPEAGTKTLRYRHVGAANKQLIASLYEGASLVQSFTHDPCPSALTTSAQTISNAIGSYADLRIRFETQDATSPPALSVTWGAVGTGASGTNTANPSYPTGIVAATSKLIAVVTGRSDVATSAFTAPAGWTDLGQFEGGTGTFAADTGTRRVAYFIKDTVTGSESGTTGNFAMTAGGATNSTMRVTIHRIEVNSGYGVDASFVSGADTTHATGFSAAASSNQSYQANDLLLIAVAQCADAATQSAQSITASGITFGTRTNRASTAVTNGNDHRHIVDSVPVSSGSGTVAPTYAYTGSASVSGPVGFLRLRATPPTEAARVTWAEFEVPVAAPAAPVVLPPRYMKATNRPGRGPFSWGRFFIPKRRRPNIVQGGSSLADAAAETVAIADTVSAVVVRLADIAETNAAADTTSNIVSTSAAVAESNAAADTASGVASTSGAINESTAGTDASSAFATFPVVQAEGSAVAETVSGAATFPVAVTESNAAADTSDGSTGTGPSIIAETNAVADAPSGVATHVAAVTESAASADAPAASLNAPVTIAETVGVSDTLSAIMSVVAAVAESLTPADSPSAVMVSLATIAETNASAETTDASITSPGLGAIAETVSAADSPSAVSTIAVQQQETSAVVDAVSAVKATTSAIVESNAIADTSDGLRSIDVTVFEVAAGNDALIAIGNVVAVMDESVSALDVVTRIATHMATVAETLAVSELVGANTPEANISESVSIADHAAWLLLGGDRTYVITAEVRVRTVTAENRAYTVPAENRSDES